MTLQVLKKGFRTESLNDIKVAVAKKSSVYRVPAPGEGGIRYFVISLP